MGDKRAHQQHSRDEGPFPVLRPTLRSLLAVPLSSETWDASARGWAQVEETGSPVAGHLLLAHPVPAAAP